MTEDARNAIVQRDELTSFVYKMGEDLSVVNRKYKQVTIGHSW